MFVTGTRADWSKLKPLAQRARETCDVRILATGMHLCDEWGQTVIEVERDMRPEIGCVPKVHRALNRVEQGSLPVVLADTASAVGRLVNEQRPDAVVVHGDRAEALAGAYAAAALGARVWHVEGGEVSGSLDERTRHAVTKLADLHLVANEAAAERVRQMGENPAAVHVIGSPEVDALLGELPPVEEVAERYDLARVFTSSAGYGVALFHPVVGEPEETAALPLCMAAALASGSVPWVFIRPNADPGHEPIDVLLDNITGSPFAAVIRSMRFGHFATLIKHASVVVGNSSAVVREAPVFGTPAIEVGSRQRGRGPMGGARHVAATQHERLQEAIAASWGERWRPSFAFGDGHAADRFAGLLERPATWERPAKRFHPGGCDACED